MAKIKRNPKAFYAYAKRFQKTKSGIGPLINEKDEIVKDHQNVERAFADLNHKYERAKEVVEGLQLSEVNLKKIIDGLKIRYFQF